MRITISCPHCDSRAIARTSRELSRTLREITYTCTDPECGHNYVCNLEVVRSLTPSAKPRLDLLIPISEHVITRLMRQLELLSR